MKDIVKRFWTAFTKFWKKKHLTQILLLLALLFILISLLFFAYMAKQANVKTLKEGLTQATVIYDKDGDVATEVKAHRTSGVTIDELPEHVKDAIIAIEDHRFYEHNGFDLVGISRAFLKNLLAGRITGGGSTITQQLAKNALLSPEKTYKRKVEELFLAVEIEKTYSKDEILEMYMNEVFFGSGSWGISSASKKYFNKDIQDVTLSEAALLAGLLQAPSAYNPFENYDRAINRRDVVLNRMHEEEMISKEEYETAKSKEIKLEDGGGESIERKYPYYVDAIIDEAISNYGLTQEEILTRGYKFYTEMDQNIQASLESVYKDDSLFPKSSDDTLVQSGAVLLDPKNGGVLGLIGGRGDYVFRGYNRATYLNRQPGSTIKPLAVYTPALEEGYTPASILKDELKTYGNYTPTNASGNYQGEVPMYKALEESLNAPTVWLLNEIGLDKGIESLESFGIEIDEKKDKNLGAIALGGMNKGISPLDLAEAYSAFPNGGKTEEAHLITKIVGPTGNVVAEFKGESTKVTSKAIAGEITSMLLNVIETGTGTETQIEGVQLAGKTGSTQHSFEDINGTRDQWFAGYTGNLVGTVWLGYDETDRQHYLTGSSAETVTPLFKEIMSQALKHMDPEELEVESVNKQLQQGNGIEEMKETLKETADKVEDTIKEELPKWKRMIDEIQEDAEHLYQQFKEKIGI